MPAVIYAHPAKRLRNVEANRAARFWAKVEKGKDDECWRWLGSKDGKGYGSAVYGGTTYRATHLALMLSGSSKPSNPTGAYVDEAMALHSCDNPACVNPSHLRWGSPANNAQDREERFYGRS